MIVVLVVRLDLVVVVGACVLAMVEGFVVASAAWALAQLVNEFMLCDALLLVAAIPAEYTVFEEVFMLTMRFYVAVV